MPTSEELWMNFTFINPLSIDLHSTLHLKGYEAAVTFISIPQIFYNVPSGYVEKKVDFIKTRRTIPAGFYASPKALIDKINELIDDKISRLFMSPH